MRLPPAVVAGVERALGSRLRHATRVGGGCISPAARVEGECGDVAFVKWGDAGHPPDMFEKEARALAALGAPGHVRVPRVLGVDPGWLLLEWIEPGPATAESWQRLGRGLARLHRGRADRFGWHEDNYIGPLPQENAHEADWPAFWRSRRLEPQLRRSFQLGFFEGRERRRFDSLLGALDELLDSAAEDGPSLVHGDLWSGNVHLAADGTAALIDPAAYFGHREVDLAMSELFGGFAPGFQHAYGEEWPLLPGYAERRRPVYQLYYLLVHVNLFGAGYTARSLAAVSAAGF